MELAQILPEGQRRMGPTAVSQALGTCRQTAYRKMVSGDIKSVVVSASGNSTIRVTCEQWLADYLARLNPGLESR